MSLLLDAIEDADCGRASEREGEQCARWLCFSPCSFCWRNFFRFALFQLYLLSNWRDSGAMAESKYVTDLGSHHEAEAGFVRAEGRWVLLRAVLRLT